MQHTSKDFRMPNLASFSECSATAYPAVGPNGHEYMRCDTKRNYEDAKALCLQDGGHLVTISDQPEQDFVQALPE